MGLMSFNLSWVSVPHISGMIISKITRSMESPFFVNLNSLPAYFCLENQFRKHRGTYPKNHRFIVY